MAVHEGTGERLQELMIELREEERAWVVQERNEAERRPNPPARRAALREVRQQLARKRSAGELLGTRQALITYHLNRVLDQRGLRREWPPMPDGQRRPGRPTGRGHTAGGGYEERLSIELDDDLADLIERATWHVSAKAREELQRWSDRWGKSPVLATNTLELAAAILGGTPSADDLKRRRELRESIITTGDLLRDALQRALSS